MILRVESKPGLRVHNNPGVEPTTPEYDACVDMRIQLQDTLYSVELEDDLAIKVCTHPEGQDLSVNVKSVQYI